MCDVYASVHVFMEEKLFLRAVKGGKNTKIITLNGKKMTKIPSTIGNLPGLKVLNLQKNLVSKVCSELSTLTQLTVLNLGNNLLEEVPEEVKYLTSLKNLHLFGNRINRFASGACDGLKNLILLNLNNNQLTYIPKEVSRLESLIYLTINHNQLTSIPRELCFLKNLSELQLNYNQLICIPEEIKFLKRLRKLFLARNNIEVLPEFQHLKLKEFYCEGNPLFLKEPVSAVKQLDVLSLQEITSRFVMNELTERNPFLMEAIEWYPEVWDIISKGRKCAICGKSFLGIWIECVEFVSPSKNWKISRNLTLVPLRTLICSYQCFNLRGPNQFGIARVQSSEKLI
ncbi:leucine-rich repeat-containing protein 69 isoform X2 [Myotis myotis]|uniref:leucine-rich repeat-containing protein 69 isoform X2 n=1 Tax=Myotis myotis TaxID=51298 RepID=UPI00174C6D60|nr:leucine-rich repeat-containing protein 69 isoform X2 [Myotis myotis]